MFIYIAGPMTAKDGYTVDDNVKQGVESYLRLIRAGIPAFSPHLCALAPGAFDIDYEEWMKYDFYIITKVDALLMLPRWETSSGACREHDLAVSLGKTIYYNEDELISPALLDPRRG